MPNENAAQTAPGGDVTPLHPPKPSLAGRLWGELRRHPYAYLLTIAFAAVGAVVAPLLFPEATPAMGAIGGLVFGIYAALCAVPNKFLG